MSVRRRVELIVLALVGAVLPVLVVTAPANRGGTASGYVTMVSESGDYIGGGIARTYRSNLSYSITPTSRPTSRRVPFTFDFVAPVRPGPHSQPLPRRDPLPVPGAGRARDRRVRRRSRLQHGRRGSSRCSTSLPTGSGSSTSSTARATTPRSSARSGSAIPRTRGRSASSPPSWRSPPSTRPWPCAPIPCASRTTALPRPAVTSTVKAGGSDFSIVSNGCSSLPRARGELHRATSAGSPARPGVRLGLLEISDSRGNVREISLSGVGTSGRTAMDR